MKQELFERFFHGSIFQSLGSVLARRGFLFPLALGAVLLHAAPAGADGIIYAVISLTNDTNQCISIPFSGAHTPQLWGTQGDTNDFMQLTMS